MTLRILLCAEDALSAALARDLCDRVVAERARAEWLRALWSVPALRATQRAWQGLRPDADWADRPSLERECALRGIATNVRVRETGRRVAPHGPAAVAFRAARVAGALVPRPDLLVVAADTDGELDPALRLTGASRRHYTERELRALARLGPNTIDVLLVHEPPAGIVTELHAPPGLRPRTWNLAGEGLAQLVASLAPRVCFSGHIHARTERRLAGVRTVGLHKVAYRGSMILLEVPPRGAGEPRDLAEWGGAPDEEATARVEDDPEVPAPFDPAELDALAACLRAWAVAVRGEQPPARAERMRLHGALASEPLRAALMSALLGHDPREALERAVEPGDRARLVAAWQGGEGLPDPARLRGRG